MDIFLVEQIKSLISSETNFISNASNAASLIYNSLQNINWVGFYFVSIEELILGPFQGMPACIRIPFDKGVCGAAFRNRNTVIVPDVYMFPGHIVCDENSKSEIVVPLFYNNSVIGVLDVDSPVLDRFSADDKELFENIAEVIVKESDVQKIIEYYN